MTMNKELLYSPWRINYILSEKEKKCVFCLGSADDANHFVIHRSKHTFVILNHYPYNNGHIMVVPVRHISCLSDLSDIERNELFELVQTSEVVLKKALNADGINVGINLGKAAGAGIESHLHVHLVPRWIGDVNFMTSIGGTRVIPDSFERTYKLLKE